MPKKLLAGDQPRPIWVWTIGLGLIGILVFLVLNGPQVRIRWVSENELDVIGYNLYRAESDDGEFIRINDDALPSAADPLLGGEHFYTDSDVRWFTFYYYQLESVDRSGLTKRTESISLRSGFSFSIP